MPPPEPMPSPPLAPPLKLPMLLIRTEIKGDAAVNLLLSTEPKMLPKLEIGSLGASMPYCLFFCTFIWSNWFTHAVFESMKELIFYKSFTYNHLPSFHVKIIYCIFEEGGICCWGKQCSVMYFENKSFLEQFFL